MAKKAGTTKAQSITERADDRHALRLEHALRGLEERIEKTTKEICRIASLEAGRGEGYSPTEKPLTAQAIQREVGRLSGDLKASILASTRGAWLASNEKTNALLLEVARRAGLDPDKLAPHGTTNLEGLQAFQERKTRGLDLSDHIWQVGEQYRAQIETAIDVALTEGRTAQELSRDVRGLLLDPDKLFRRVRDKHGKLVPSKAMKAFSPGAGKYKSSYKNALRLARTEVNMAYRTADLERWRAMDFILGYEIKRSTKEQRRIRGAKGGVILLTCPLCDLLQGRYPKTFQFVGWHPQCLCYCTPILEEWGSRERREDFQQRLVDALEGRPPKTRSTAPKAGEVTDVPEGFKRWQATQLARLAEEKRLWARPPYFVRDNFVDGDIAKGLRHMSPRPPMAETYKDVYKGMVFVSPYHGANEIDENIRFAKLIVDKEGKQVYLLPRLDPMNVRDIELRKVLLPKGVPENKNVDFFIEGKLFEGKSMLDVAPDLDRKGQKREMETRIKKAKKQAENIIIEVPLYFDKKTISETVINYLDRSKFDRTIYVIQGMSYIDTKKMGSND